MAHSNPDVILIPNGFQNEYTIGFANALAGHDVASILVTSDELPVERLHPAVRPVNLRGSQDPKRKTIHKALNMLRYAFRVMVLIVSNRSTVHLMGLFALRSVLGGLLEAALVRVLARQFVLTVHNLLPHDRHTAVNRMVYRLIYRLPHLLVVHTQQMRQALVRDFGVDEGRIRVIEHGINEIRPHVLSERERVRAAHGVQPSEKLVLFFGNIVYYKGLDVLIKAWSQLPAHSSLRLLIAGRCRDAELRRTLRNSIDTLPNVASVRWLDGFVSDDEVPALFHAADLLVMPYRHIDQSGVVFMAMACGLTVLSTDVGSLKQYVLPLGGRVIAPNDAKALSLALIEWEQAFSVAQAQASRSRVLLAAEKYLWSRTVEPLLVLYRRPEDRGDA